MAERASTALAFKSVFETAPGKAALTMASKLDEPLGAAAAGSGAFSAGLGGAGGVGFVFFPPTVPMGLIDEKMYS